MFSHPFSCFCSSLSLQLRMLVLQLCRCSPSGSLSFKDQGNTGLPLAWGAKLTWEATWGVSVGSLGGGGSFTLPWCVACAPAWGCAGLHGRSCGFTSPRKAVSQVPWHMNFLGVGCSCWENTWVTAPNTLVPSGRQAHGNNWCLLQL